MADDGVRRVTERPGSEYGLRELLLRWGLDEMASGIAKSWRCNLAPHAPDDDAALDALIAGVPVTCCEDHAAKVMAGMVSSCPSGVAGAPDSSRSGVEWVQNGPWGRFSRPKISFKGGWGRPGQPMVDEKALHMVRSFEAVLTEGDVPLNLQMFHRDAVEESTASGAELPVLPDLLEWPLARFLSDDTGAAGVSSAVTVDRATRVSRAGAVTWWHLDDCGEFVFQVALPEPLRRNGLIGPGGKPVVKIFIFADKAAYELITQDDAMNDSGCFAGLDLFATADNELPRSAVGDSAVSLPPFTIALLEAGGRPLLSPPNAPHLVITHESCVMVEQRRVSKLFLDEVLYFQLRMQRWMDPPIQYEFVSVSLQDPKYLKLAVFPLLLQMLKEEADHDHDTKERRWLSIRAFHSLSALRIQFSDAFAKGAPGESAALQLESILAEGNAKAWHDPRAAAQHEIVTQMSTGKTGLLKLGGKVAAYVHENGSARWGPARNTEGAAIGDRICMQNALKDGQLSRALDELTEVSDRDAAMKLVATETAPAVEVSAAAPIINTQVNEAHAMDDLFD